MKTIAAIILSSLMLWAPSYGQEEPVYLASESFSINARFHQPATSPLFGQSDQGLFFRDSSLILATPGAFIPSARRSSIEMDSTASYFTITQTIDGNIIGIPAVVSIDEYVKLSQANQTKAQFKKVVSAQLQAEDKETSQSIELIGADIAGQRVSLRVRGNVNITGKLRNEDRTKTTNVNTQTQSNTFQIEQKQAFKIEGKIGDRISIQVDQDSERDFDFENNMEIYYKGTEDEIIQRVEAGNISLNLPGTKLAMFSGQNNGLFGLKALAKVGPVDITAIASLERGRKEKLSLSGDSEASAVSIEDYGRRRNTYFYVNNFYRRKSYPLTDNGEYQLSGRRIKNIRVYKFTDFVQSDDISYFAKIYIDPNQPDDSLDFQESRRVVQLVQEEDFTLNENLGFIRMNTPVQNNEILAIAYVDTFDQGENLTVVEYDSLFNPVFRYQEGSDIALGTPGIADTLILKMIKPDDALPDHPTWDLEWKNVYYLKSTGINSDGFELKMRRSLGGDESEIADDGTYFLELFGLDRKGVGTVEEPDGVIDLDYGNILNLNRGELIFPYLNPFMADSVVANQPDWMVNSMGQALGNGGNPNLTPYPEYQSSSFYTYDIGVSDYRKDSKFRMDVSYANQSSTFNLGFNVIEGSEEVTLNGVLLQRGASKDYTIDYFSGQLLILNEAALAPGANLDIKYELNEFFQLDKKVIMGTRAEIKFGEKKNSFIGLSAIYFSKSSIDEKVRVGKEPMENFIWDLNARITQDLPWLTRGLDWMPLIKTDANSHVTLSGEIAQVIPNPNTSVNEKLGDFGVAYIDDFEGSRREAQISIIRGSWGLASIPFDGSGRNNRERAFTYWYNPYNRILTKQIWPNKETSAQAQNDVTDILVLKTVPDSSFSVQAGEAAGDAWGGIMRSLSSGYYDQSESKFLELWVRGDQGRLHVDLGYISEDLQEQGETWTARLADENSPGDSISINKGYGNTPDTEDIPSQVFPTGDGFIVEEEDLGLDGLPYTTPVNTNLYGWHHPAWDRYEFDPNTSPIDYRHINGSEGNLQIEGGTYPNTEDLNNDGALDSRNAYFTMNIDLTTDEYVAGRTKFSDGSETGWKLISIPLADFYEAGDGGTPKWSQIKFARLWMDEIAAQGSALQIAAIDIVGNDWQERGVFSRYDGFETNVTDSLSGTLNVMVINTEDNPSRYNADATEGSYSAPPAGVEGILDPLTQLRSKEQSLVIRADDLAPGYSVVADKQFHGTKAKDFIHYKTLKLFLHGWDKSRGGSYEATFSDYIIQEESQLEFFFRFGETDDDYYELRRPIYPGWDERNNLEVNMSDLANFKLALEDSIFASIPVMGMDSVVYDTSLYWIDLPADYKYATKRLADGSTIAVSGRPSLSRVRLLKTGFKNLSDGSMTGEIWLDELRLSDVEKNTATAYRANLSMQFADIAKINMDIQKDDADFHNVQSQFGSGDNSIALNISGSLSAHKLLPDSWGLSIPVSASYRNNKREPKYITGSDIRIADLDPALRDTLETMTVRNESYNWNMSLSRKEKSEHWLPKYTLDAMNFSLGHAKNTSSNATKSEQKSEKLDGKFSYKLNLGKDFTVEPLGFLESIPLIGETMSATQIGYLPNNVGFNGSMVENRSSSIYRNPNSTPKKPVHTLSMNRSYNLDWSLLSTLSARYSANMANNLDSLKDRKEDIVTQLDLGHLGSFSESYGFNWNPKGIKLFSPTFSYSSNFSALDKITASQPGLNLNVSANTSANMSLKLSEIFGLIHKPDGKKESSSKSNTQVQRGRGRGRTTPDPGEEETEEKEETASEPLSLTKILDFTHKTLGRVDPISMSISQGRQSSSSRQIAALETVGDTTIARELNISDIGYGYRMGLRLGDDVLSHPDATNPIANSDNFKLDFRSGLKLSKSMSTKLSFSIGRKSSLANQSTGEIVTSNMDFLPSGTIFGVPVDEESSFGNLGIPFPSFNLRYSGLKDIKWIKKYINGASLDMNYAGKRNTTQEKGIITRETYSIAFSPLIGLSIQGKKNINGSLNYRLTKNISNSISVADLTTSTQNFSQSVNASLSYAHKGGLNIPLPMMEDKYLENNIDFRLEISYTHEKDYIGTEGVTSIEFGEGKFNKSLSARPSIQYSFTDKVSGNVTYEYRVSDTRLTGKQAVSDFQFGVNIQIKG